MHSLWYEHAKLLLHNALTDLNDATAAVPAPVRVAVSVELEAEAKCLRNELAEYTQGVEPPETDDRRFWDFGAPFVAFEGGMEALSAEARNNLDRREEGADTDGLQRGVTDLRLLVDAYSQCDSEHAMLDMAQLSIMDEPYGSDRYYLSVDAPPVRDDDDDDFKGWSVEIGRWDVDLDDPEHEEGTATGETVLRCVRSEPPDAHELVDLLNRCEEKPDQLAAWAITPIGEPLTGTTFVVTKRYDD